MSNKVRALVWEELRIGGVLALWVFLGGAVGLLCMKASANTDLRMLADPLVQVFAVGTPLCLAIVLTVSRTNAGDLSHAFSTRILRLPVPTWLTVTVSLTARALLMFAVTALLSLQSLWLFGDGDWGVWNITFLLTEGYLVLQVLIWLGGPLRGLQHLLLGVLAAAGFVLLLTSDLLGEALVNGLAHAAMFPVPAVVAAVAIAIAVPSVKATRGGRGVNMPGPATWLACLHDRLHTPPQFHTPLAAQQWFFMRREGRNLAVTVAGIWAFAFVGAALLVLRGGEQSGTPVAPLHMPPYIVHVLPYIVHVAMVIGCFLYGVQGFNHYKNFAYRYPMGASDLAKTKIAAVGKVFAAILALAFLFIVGTRLFMNDAATFTLFTEALAAQEISLREVIRYSLGVSVASGLLAWALLTFYTRATLMAVVVLPLVVGKGMLEPMLMAPVWIAWTVGAWAVAWRKRLVPARALLFGATAWALLALLLRGLYPDAGMLAAIGFASLGPLPFAALVLDINRARHGSDRAKAHRATTALRPRRRTLFASGVVLALAFLTWLNVPESPRYIATWRAQGLPATPEDLEALYPAPPEAERLPSPYERVAEQLKTREAAYFSKAEVREQFLQGLDHHDYLLIAGKRRSEPGEPIDAETWRFTRTYHEEVTRPIVPLTHEAATQDPGAYQYRANVLDNTAQPGPAGLSGALRLDAFVAAMEDRPHDAAEAIRMLFPLAAFYRPHPRLDAQRLFMREVQGAASIFEDTLSRTSLSETDAAALQEAFDAALPEQPATIHGLIGERVVDLAGIERAKREEPATAVIFLDSVVARAFVTRSSANAIEALERGDLTVQQSFSDLSVTRAGPAYEWFVPLELDARTRVALASTAAATERYRLAHAQWPESLDALVPAYLERVPTDPYSKRPLRYRLTDDGGCVIYSIGPNQRDDGGQKPAHNDMRGNDITFRLFSEARRAAAREIVPTPPAPGAEALDMADNAGQ